MSGFETGVAVMPLVSGDETDPIRSIRRVPLGRVRNTRKLLAAAAVIMSVLLLTSSFVTTLLIPEEAYREGGPASGRAIAYLAHEMLGKRVRDGLRRLDNRDPLVCGRVRHGRPAASDSAIPASVRHGAAMGFLSPADGSGAFHHRSHRHGGFPGERGGAGRRLRHGRVWCSCFPERLRSPSRFGRNAAAASPCTSGWSPLVFAFTLIDNVIERPDGVIIAPCSFLPCSPSALSAAAAAPPSFVWRKFSFRDGESEEHWPEIVGKKVHLVPLRTNTAAARKKKLADVRKYYAIKGPVAFIYVQLMDNRSEFLLELRVRVSREDEDYVVEVFGAPAIANTIAYVSELIDPISIFLGLTRQNLMTQALRYLFLGEGETGLMVYTILLKYWEWTPEDDVRPLIFLMSE